MREKKESGLGKNGERFFLICVVFEEAYRSPRGLGRPPTRRYPPCQQILCKVRFSAGTPDRSFLA